MIDLGRYEDGAKHPGDYHADLAAMQERLTRIQVAHIVHRRAAIDMIPPLDPEVEQMALGTTTPLPG